MLLGGGQGNPDVGNVISLALPAGKVAVAAYDVGTTRAVWPQLPLKDAPLASLLWVTNA